MIQRSLTYFFDHVLSYFKAFGLARSFILMYFNVFQFKRNINLVEQMLTELFYHFAFKAFAGSHPSPNR